jgi:hypothetical protein
VENEAQYQWLQNGKRSTLLEDVRTSSIMEHNPIAARANRRQLDYVLAFPQAPVKKELFLHIPKGFDINKGKTKSFVLKVHPNIYGQKQAWPIDPFKLSITPSAETMNFFSETLKTGSSDGRYERSMISSSLLACLESYAKQIVHGETIRSLGDSSLLLCILGMMASSHPLKQGPSMFLRENHQILLRTS